MEFYLYNFLEKKAKIITANPKANIGDEAKHGDGAQIITKESVHKLLTTLKPREEGQIHQILTASF